MRISGGEVVESLAVPAGSSVYEQVWSITYLRGLAALTVAWCHVTFGQKLYATSAEVVASGRWSWLAVECFFVISGFVLPYSMARDGYRFPRDIGTFFVKRVIRLDPCYFASAGLLLMVVKFGAEPLGLADTIGPVDVPRLLLNLAYLVPFVPGEKWISGLYWTLGMEFQYYLLISIVFSYVVSPVRATRLAILLIVCMIDAVLPWKGFLLFYMPLVVMGMAAFQYRAGLADAAEFLMVVLAAGLLLAISGRFAHGIGWAALCGVVSALAIAFWRPGKYWLLNWLGEISYSLYLTHMAIVYLVVGLAGWAGLRQPGSWLVPIASILASIAFASIFHLLVERPTRRIASRLRYSTRPVLQQAAS
jgi:peptidoglycan/LPS O-acetylase OafA/YrhL